MYKRIIHAYIPAEAYAAFDLLTPPTASRLASYLHLGMAQGGGERSSLVL